MAIPKDVLEKLDSDPAWAVQHEDIVRVMDETPMDKPWSRYMIQQHLDGDPAKKTVIDRLGELVELGVLVEYEYNSHSLYDLAFDPLVTDGGQLRNANPFELFTLRDIHSLRDLSMGLFFTGMIFVMLGVLVETLGWNPNPTIATNFYVEVGFVLFFSALVGSILVMSKEKIVSMRSSGIF